MKRRTHRKGGVVEVKTTLRVCSVQPACLHTIQLRDDLFLLFSFLSLRRGVTRPQSASLENGNGGGGGDSYTCTAPCLLLILTLWVPLGVDIILGFTETMY